MIKKLLLVSALLTVISQSAFAEESFSVRIYNLEDYPGGNCVFSAEATNNTNQTFEGFFIRLKLVDASGALITKKSLQFVNHRPGKTVSEDNKVVRNAACGEIAKAIVESVEYCMYNDQDHDNCEKFLRFPDGKIEMSL